MRGLHSIRWAAGTGSACSPGSASRSAWSAWRSSCAGRSPPCIGAAGAAVLGYFVFAWPEAVAGAAGGVAGAYGTAPVVTGALRRGGTRAGLALLVRLGAIAAAAVAFVPVLGYLEAAGMPGVAARVRSAHTRAARGPAHARP